MGLPANIDNYTTMLSYSREELLEQGVEVADIQRVERVRLLYTHWLQCPHLSNHEMVQWDMEMEKAAGRELKKSQAYYDIQLVQVVIGNIQVANKDFVRWRVTQMLEEDRKAARRAGDFRSAVAAADKIAKYHQLDKPDTPDLQFDKIGITEFHISSNPGLIGSSLTQKQLEKKIKSLNKEFGRDVEDVTYQEVNDDE